MKKALISILALSLTVLVFSATDAKMKKNAKVSPCVKKCRVENYKCRNIAKKSKPAERKAKYAECLKNKKECHNNCRLKKTAKIKKSENTENSEE